MNISIKEWYLGRCSLYAVVRDDSCLADSFLDQLEKQDHESAKQLAGFIDNLSRETYIRTAMLRDEVPALGIYAMYRHNFHHMITRYNPSRLLCGFAGESDRIMIVGAGFVKTIDQSIQRNPLAYREATFLSGVINEINVRIDTGEIKIEGSLLLPQHSDSFSL